MTRTIWVIRLNDGTLFYTMDFSKIEKYWDAHQDEIRYLREYYDKSTFEHYELCESGECSNETN